MTHVSLFAGIGGLDLAAEWAGFETILQVERDPYCLRVLRKHWPRVRRVRDVRHVKDIRRKVGNRAVDVLSGGFPCQPFSVAGKRLGTADSRNLWPRMRDVVECIRPRWVVAENVRGLLSWSGGMAFEAVCTDLEALGYEVLPLVYPVAGVGAPHLRYRVFIVAESASLRLAECPLPTVQKRSGEQRSIYDGQLSGRSEGLGSNTSNSPGERRGEGRAEPVHAREAEPERDSENVSHTEGGRCNGNGERSEATERFESGRFRNAANPSGKRLSRQRVVPIGVEAQFGNACDNSWWAVEPDVCRVAHGIPARVDRLRGLGNAVSPYQAFPVFQAIAATEEA